MRSWLILYTFFLTLTASSQSPAYFPFPDSNAVWTVNFWNCCWASCPSPPAPNPVVADYNFSYYLQGDTLINAQNYHQVYRSAGTRHEHCAVSGSMSIWTNLPVQYMGAYRQDVAARKVFFIYESTFQESILYDFSLNVGDTLSLSFICGSCIVSSIDSALIGNNYRKQFHFMNSPYSVIEGIGNTAGLLEPIQPFENGGALICFSQNGQTLYPDTLTACNIVTAGINEVSHSDQIIIYPNPFSEFTSIKVPPGFVNSELSIYNSKGALAISQKIKSVNTRIQRDGLSNGLYICRLVSANGKTVYAKFVVE
jgi:hypothetical protein